MMAVEHDESCASYGYTPGGLKRQGACTCGANEKWRRGHPEWAEAIRRYYEGE